MKDGFLKRFCEYEKKGGSFPLLSYRLKWVGFGICLTAIVGLLFIALQEIDHTSFYKELLMHIILIGLLFIVLAREKNEDERIHNLRYRAFAFAFILGTVMLLLMPLAAIVLDTIAGRLPLEWEQDQSFFFIISSYLFYYLMYFQIFKRQL